MSPFRTCSGRWCYSKQISAAAPRCGSPVSRNVGGLVIAPVRASPLDLKAIDPLIEICQDLGKPFLFVMSAYDSRWKFSESAHPFLEQKAPSHTLEEVFRYRQAYVGSMIGGATRPE